MDKKLVTEEDLSGTGWEAKTQDNEWVTVPSANPVSSATGNAPSAPNASTLAPLQGTPSAPTQAHTKLWSGDFYKAPATIFDETYDEVLLQSYLERLPQYRALTGRFNPFAIDKLRPLLEGSHYSTFISRQVITFKDALDHAFQLCLFWKEEDDSVVIQAEKELAPHPVIDTAEPEDALELAKLAWKEAVAKRAEALAQWDDYVAEYRLRYQIEKSKRKKK